ncbi:MAG: type II 3-dehydroquinate dehydratase [Candidatus Eremiobacteraeota bacterium]|nr:type II 3-dehydroquinate dehydratase [Candidatus Eremiobacteraeota bacterium]
MRLTIIHGPNLNLLGTREPEMYGRTTLEEINVQIQAFAMTLSATVHISQSNHEGEIIDALHAARQQADVVIINPGAYTHYSYAIADAVSAIGIPVIEVHLSNIFARETFRRTSVIAPVCIGSIAGFGPDSYILAMRAAAALNSSKSPETRMP